MKIQRLLIGCLWALPFLALGQERLPVKYFTNFTDYKSVVISPDGRYYAARAVNDGKTALIFIRREDMQVTGSTKGPDEGHITSVRWVTNERVVYTAAVDNGYLDAALHTNDLYAVNYDGSNNQTIFDRRATNYDIISTLPNEKDYILLAVYPPVNGFSRTSRNLGRHTEIVKLDIKWGRSRELFRVPLRNSYPIADENGNVRFAIATNLNDETRVFYRTADDGEWMEHSIDELNAFQLRPISLSNDGEYATLWADQGADGMGSLYRYHLATKQLQLIHDSQQVTLGEWLFDPQTRRPIIGITMPGQYEYHYFDPEHRLTRVHRSLVNAFGGQHVTFTSYTDDLRHIVVFVHSDKNPGEYYLFNTETNKAKYLLATRSWVDRNKMRPMQPIQLQSRDGLSLHGYLTTPDDSGEPHPMVVLPHGGPFGIRDTWGYDWAVQMLAHYGYAVLQVNFRGSGGYGINFEEAGYRQYGQGMQDDVTDATRWAIEQGYADKNRVCIFGTSYGGYAALMGVIREPDLYRCAIGYAGVYDLPMLFEEGGLRFYDDGEAYLKKTVGTDDSELAAYSPSRRAADIQVPLMIAHGGEDRIVPEEHAEALRDALDEAGKDYEWIYYRRELHGFSNQKHLQEFYTKVLSFLDEHIGS